MRAGAVVEARDADEDAALLAVDDDGRGGIRCSVHCRLRLGDHVVDVVLLLPVVALGGLLAQGAARGGALSSAAGGLRTTMYTTVDTPLHMGTSAVAPSGTDSRTTRSCTVSSTSSLVRKLARVLAHREDVPFGARTGWLVDLALARGVDARDADGARLHVQVDGRVGAAGGHDLRGRGRGGMRALCLLLRGGERARVQPPRP